MQVAIEYKNPTFKEQCKALLSKVSNMGSKMKKWLFTLKFNVHYAWLSLGVAFMIFFIQYHNEIFFILNNLIY